MYKFKNHGDAFTTIILSMLLSCWLMDRIVSYLDKYNIPYNKYKTSWFGRCVAVKQLYYSSYVLQMHNYCRLYPLNSVLYFEIFIHSRWADIQLNSIWISFKRNFLVQDARVQISSSTTTLFKRKGCYFYSTITLLCIYSKIPYYAWTLIKTCYFSKCLQFRQQQ